MASGIMTCRNVLPIVHLQAIARDLCRMTGLPDNTKLELYKEVKGGPVVVERIDDTWVLLGGCHRFIVRCRDYATASSNYLRQGHFHLPTWWSGLCTSLWLQGGHGHGTARGR
jgi:hypothetical protein